MFGHGLGGDVLKHLVRTQTAILLGPRHTNIAVFVDLLLPVAQELELLIGTNLHEGFRQNKAWVGGFVLSEPAVGLLLKLCDFRLRHTHLSSSLMLFFVVRALSPSLVPVLRNLSIGAISSIHLAT